MPYDLLVGADGAGSAVRAAIQQVMPAGYARRYRHKQMYSMAQVERPANPEDIPQHAVFQAHMLAAKVAPTWLNVQSSAVITFTGVRPTYVSECRILSKVVMMPGNQGAAKVVRHIAACEHLLAFSALLHSCSNNGFLLQQ